MTTPHPEPRKVFDHYAESLRRLGEEFDAEGFSRAVDLIDRCRGMVVITGMGKAGLIGQKVSATLASTGTPSIFLHPTEAIHGDLGRVRSEDIVIALSNSGASEEIVRLMEPLKKIGARVIAITSKIDSPLAVHADVVLWMGSFEEACPIGLAPTTSTTLMLAIGDVLAIAAMHRRQFSREEFALFHPGGSLGRKLLSVGEVMRSGDENPVVGLSASIADALIVMTRTKGRPGAVSVINDDGTLAGVYTDGDLRRDTSDAIQEGSFALFSMPIAKIMTRTPRTIGPDQLAAEALNLLRSNRIDQIPVVDDENRPIGLVDVQDLLDIGVA